MSPDTPDEFQFLRAQPAQSLGCAGRAESDEAVYEWVWLHGVLKECLLCVGADRGGELKHTNEPSASVWKLKLNIFLINLPWREKSLPRVIGSKCQTCSNASERKIHLTLSLDSSGRYGSVAFSPAWGRVFLCRGGSQAAATCGSVQSFSSR